MDITGTETYFFNQKNNQDFPKNLESLHLCPISTLYKSINACNHSTNDVCLRGLFHGEAKGVLSPHLEGWGGATDVVQSPLKQGGLIHPNSRLL